MSNFKYMRIFGIIYLFALPAMLNGQSRDAYVVDTIAIENVHKAFIEKSGSQLTLYFDGSQIDIVKRGNIRDIINDDKIFFSSINYYSFFTPKNASEKAPLNCSETLVNIQKGKVEISRVEGVDSFILCLINIEAFNRKQESVDFKPWRTQLDQGAYIRVVYPLCHVKN